MSLCTVRPVARLLPEPITVRLVPHMCGEGVAGHCHTLRLVPPIHQVSLGGSDTVMSSIGMVDSLCNISCSMSQSACTYVESTYRRAYMLHSQAKYT